MKYKLILFDADGTLFDFDKAEKNAFDKTMKSFGIKDDLNLLHTEYEKINKAIWQDFEEKKISSKDLRIERFKRFFENQELDLKPEKVSPVYLVNLSKGIDLIDGAEKVVKFLHGKCELALATNGLSDVQRPRFAKSALSKYFKHIFISEEIGFPKPEKEYFDFIFEQLPFRDSAMIIGDNLRSDIQGGNRNGIPSCWFNPAKLENTSGIVPSFEIHDLAEIKKLVY